MCTCVCNVVRVCVRERERESVGAQPHSQAYPTQNGAPESCMLQHIPCTVTSNMHVQCMERA